MRIFDRLRLKTIRKSKSNAIGIIGGADGPTTIVVSRSKYHGKSKRSEFENFLEELQATQKPNAHNFSEIESYLIKEHHAEVYSLSPKRLEMFKADIIMNHFKHLLELPPPLGENPTKRQIIAYYKNDTSFEQARNYPAEGLGLDIRAYRIHNQGEQETIVQVEMTTEHLTIHSSWDGLDLTIRDNSAKLADEIIRWIGISQKDIDERSPRFIGYADRLRNAEKI